MRILILVLIVLATWTSGDLSTADDRPEWKTSAPLSPEIAAASDEGANALSGFKVPKDIRGTLFAAEPMVANVVAFHVDAQGKLYACETFRQSKGVEDNRGHDHWLDDDLAAQTVEDRYAYIMKHLGEKAADYTRQDDRIRLLVDEDGDFVADKATVFADRFNEVVAGTGAGVLAYRDKVYYTCIPDLWMLEDANGDYRSDQRKSLQYGYGVRFAFRGHDLHGLTLGPDGRLYFSIGDRGYNVQAADGQGINPASGAVFRCELDGSRLEVFAMGLRNPQELAFDDFGNLFTGDNNSDSGDKARWVYVVQGGDTGWRMHYQYLGDRGPFNREKIWHPFHEQTPAYIIPPVANFADGPSGLAYYPGTGFSDDFKGRFFLCDFRGQASNSGIRSLKVEPKGAFFEIADSQRPFWKILATDLQFAPDGGLYVSDWVNGWEGLGKGRIYRFSDARFQDSELVRETQQLLGGKWSEHDEFRLSQLLEHADQRVRREAQFELARREAFEALDGMARHHQSLLARIHAIWGLEQLARRDVRRDAAVETFGELLSDPEAEIRSQAARMLGELRDSIFDRQLIQRLSDTSSRVRYMAAMALGRNASGIALKEICQLLVENNNQDPILRHGGIMALAGIGSQDPSAIVDLHSHPSSAIRLASVVALRKLKSAELGRFLMDPAPEVALEAARAVHDLPINDAMQALADLIEIPSDSDPLLRRILNANYRLGTATHAERLAIFAARSTAPEAMRIEALNMLGSWEKPASRDRVLGSWYPLEARDPEDAARALNLQLPSILGAGGDVAYEAIDVASKLGIKEITPALLELVGNDEIEPQTRASGLRALGLLKADSLKEILTQYLDHDSPSVRMTALDLMIEQSPEIARPMLERRISAKDMSERQMAVKGLARMDHPDSRKLLIKMVDQLASGQLSPDMQLEVLEAAEASDDDQVKNRLSLYSQTIDPAEPMTQYKVALEGGNAESGRILFYERTSLSCVRCHKVGDSGGEVGPNLSGIGKDKTREYLLEAIIHPSRSIAKGYESVLVQTIDGSVISGILRSETDDEMVLVTAEGNLIRVPQDDIDDVVPGKSSMPEDLIKHLNRRELRDLIEFLAQQKSRVE